ncbi:hypothetical protein H0H87_009796 [Tephrocybe sp. NHM501043]|nr:hypothetical protein H0H87_000334 [Tephrocybe sp. NHM501043]KAG6842867.1 hypothetical protein H0H87_009796 [Tephrocybe sp. NHM501043]
MTEQTKITRFMKGLKSSVKDHLVNIIDCSLTLEAWEPLVISIDMNLHQREIEKWLETGKKKTPNHNQSNQHTIQPATHTVTPVTNTSSTSDVVPMEVDSISSPGTSKPCGPLTTAEREHCMKNNLCLYCGKEGHKAVECNKHKAKHGDTGKAKPKTN